MKVIYTGTQKIKLNNSEGLKKLIPGDIVEISDKDWESLSVSGNFKPYENESINITDDKIRNVSLKENKDDETESEQETKKEIKKKRK